MLAEAIEDLCDGKDDGEIDRRKDAETHTTPKGVNEDEENDGVSEIEAVRNLT